MILHLLIDLEITKKTHKINGLVIIAVVGSVIVNSYSFILNEENINLCIAIMLHLIIHF